jgi:amidohydrolase
MIRGGTQPNIVPSEVEMSGTVRSLDPKMRTEIRKRVESTAAGIAQSSGAKAQVSFVSVGAPVTFNDAGLLARIRPALERAAGPGKSMVVQPVTAGEDLAFYQERIPGVFFFLGVAPKNADPSKLAMNHSPSFFVDESALVVGVRALSHVAVSYPEAR